MPCDLHQTDGSMVTPSSTLHSGPACLRFWKVSGSSRRLNEPCWCGHVTARVSLGEESWQTMAGGLAGSWCWPEASGARRVPGSRHRAKAVSLAWAFLGAWDLGVGWVSVGGSIPRLCSKQRHWIGKGKRHLQEGLGWLGDSQDWSPR